MVQCRDGMWSHSGGRPGACSHHGGVRGKVVAAAGRRSCGHVRAGNGSKLRFHVTIERGHVTCHRARHVLRHFLNGGGHMHGPKNGALAEQTWTIGRWRCGFGTGGGACMRHGSDASNARDYILAQS
jgi:hypothetical protein